MFNNQEVPGNERYARASTIDPRRHIILRTDVAPTLSSTTGLIQMAASGGERSSVPAVFITHKAGRALAAMVVQHGTVLLSVNGTGEGVCV